MKYVLCYYLSIYFFALIIFYFLYDIDYVLVIFYLYKI